MWIYASATVALFVLVKVVEGGVEDEKVLVADGDKHKIENKGQVIAFSSILSTPEESRREYFNNFSLVTRKFSKDYCARITEGNTVYCEANIDGETLEGFCLSAELLPTDVVKCKCTSRGVTVVDYSLSRDHCQRRVYTRLYGDQDGLFHKKFQACDFKEDLEDCKKMQLEPPNEHWRLNAPSMKHLLGGLIPTFGRSQELKEQGVYFCDILPTDSTSEYNLDQFTIKIRKWSHDFCSKNIGRSGLNYRDINFNGITLDAFCIGIFLEATHIVSVKCTAFNNKIYKHVIDYTGPPDVCQRRVYTRPEGDKYYKIIVKKCDEEEELQACLNDKAAGQ